MFKINLEIGTLEGGITYEFVPLDMRPMKDYGRIIDVQTVYFSSFCLSETGKCFVTGNFSYNCTMEAPNWTLISTSIIPYPVTTLYAACSNTFFITGWFLKLSI